MKNLGTLYIVSTPIGNLDDITFRAIKILKKVDLIVAEDTIYSKIFLHHYNIFTKLISLHKYNEKNKDIFIQQKLQKGLDIALISDSGTPLICDPGFILVKNAIKNNVQVIPIPGPCAAITALSVSGLPSDKFIFEGFLSHKQTQRIMRLKILKNELRTIIFYESPHRLLETIDDMIAIFGDTREVVIAKELTKVFEKIKYDTLINIKNWLLQDIVHKKGEFVILVKGIFNEKKIINDEVLQMFNIILENSTKKDAILLTSKIMNISKNELYKMAKD